MLKRDITFANLDGDTVTRTFYFNLTVPEILGLNDEYPGGDFRAYLLDIVAREDKSEMIKTFDKLILKSVGKRDEDDMFVKTDAYTNGFGYSEAYSTLFLEICTDAGKAAEFFNGVMPAKLVEEAKKAAAKGISLENITALEIPEKKLEEYTEQELLEMPFDEFQGLMAKQKGSVPLSVLQIALRKKR